MEATIALVAGPGRRTWGERDTYMFQLFYVQAFEVRHFSKSFASPFLLYINERSSEYVRCMDREVTR
jgi:hypothetical protein